MAKTEKILPALFLYKKFTFEILLNVPWVRKEIMNL